MYVKEKHSVFCVRIGRLEGKVRLKESTVWRVESSTVVELSLF